MAAATSFDIGSLLDEYDERDTVTQMHPALDVVGDTLYVTVRTALKDGTVQDVVLTSEGNTYTVEQWQAACPAMGLVPRARVDLSRCGPRWNGKGVRALAEGTLAADVPTWDEVYQAVYAALDGHLVVCEQAYLTVLALFAIMTYFHPLFEMLPMLHLRGPAGSGKGRACAALAATAFNGCTLGYPTPAVLFRYANQGRYTAVITDADNLARVGSGDAFARQLQSAAYKTEATVDIAEGGGNKGAYQPTTYYTFSPRVFASTTPIQSAPLRTRSIELDIVKTANPDETKLDRTISDDRVWAPLRDKLYRLLLCNWRDVRTALVAVKAEWRGEGMPSGRVKEKWLPLATIAKLVSADVFAEVTTLARADMAAQQEDAGTTFDAVLFKFAAWLVRDGDRAMRRDDLWAAFVDGPANMYDRPDTVVPTWAKDMDAAVTVGQLQKWIRGKGVLVSELQKRKLIPNAATKTNKCNLYQLSQGCIMGTVRAYLGESIDALLRPAEPAEDEYEVSRQTSQMPASHGAYWRHELDYDDDSILANDGEADEVEDY